MAYKLSITSKAPTGQMTFATEAPEGDALLAFVTTANSPVVPILTDAMKNAISLGFITASGSPDIASSVETYVDNKVGSGGGGGGTGLNWRGVYDPTTSYNPYDAVTFNGSSYICVVGTTGNAPTDTGYWETLAQRGSTGAVGPAGPVGPQGIAGPKGDTGAAGPQGVAGAQGLTGPAGPAGAPGPAGPQGTQGLTGPAGPAGPQGIQGIQGPAGAQGIQGPKGDTGAVGPAGPAGPQGIQGPAGANGTSVLWRGAYGNATAYAVNDAVSYNGSSYICIATSTGNLPTDPAHWNLLAQQGATGPTGPRGYTGNWRGAYNAATAYAAGDAVSFNGSSYISIAATTGNDPTNATYWNLLAQEGAQGPAGPAGAGAPGGVVTDKIVSGKSISVDANSQYLVYRTLTVQGTIDLSAGGKIVII